jgi:hypothetical protein
LRPLDSLLPRAACSKHSEHQRSPGRAHKAPSPCA